MPANLAADLHDLFRVRAAQREWTLGDLNTLPPTLYVTDADSILGIGSTLGKRLRREGTYPLRVLPLGRRPRVSTAELLAFLKYGHDSATGTSEVSIEEAS